MYIHSTEAAVKILSNPNVYENVQLLMPDFTGWFDAPTWSLSENLDAITISGWLIPRKQPRNYHLRVQYPDSTSMIVHPKMPRPEVPAAYTALPLKGAIEFCGFYAQLPVADDVSIFVVFDNGDEIFWTKIQYRDANDDFIDTINTILTLGYSIDESSTQRFNTMSVPTRELCIDYYFHHLKTEDVNTALTNAKADSKNIKYQTFLEILNSNDFFSQLLQSQIQHQQMQLPNPFLDGHAKLVLSHFQEDLKDIRQHVNYLVFDSGCDRFYIEQHMHSIDCVFFPSLNHIVRFPHSGQFSRTKLKKFLQTVLIPGHESKQINTTPLSPKFGGVIMNSLSPHHFFYDFLPAIEIAYENKVLSTLPQILSLEGMCYFPLNTLYDLTIPNIKIDWKDLKALCSTQNMYFVTAGVSHKMVPRVKTKQMDQRIIHKSLSHNHHPEVLKITQQLAPCFPRFLIGISAFGRSWLNQEEFLKSFLLQLLEIYPNCCLVFDGVTSHSFGYQNEEPLFQTDKAIVDRICAHLPTNARRMSLVGLSSIEKIYIAKNIDFSFTNISTGTMYTSRFYDIPGVGHICQSLLYLENLVGRFNTSVKPVPKELIHDAKPYSELLNHSDLDFMDYTMDTNRLRDFLLSEIKNALNKK